ncbi:hypothetical protein ACPPVO_48040 [Dactylosporangium sp. McL0621]|uniref:hypothetical protein n=1 Tax=Dactylosporangium sp. McL0621 TaxID=3415678 RepID=UPI003CE88945
MVRFRRRPDDPGNAARDQGPRSTEGRHYPNRETAAGVFSRPPAPVPVRPKPPPPPAEPEEAPSLSVRPLRTPAPAVTTIRVEPLPVDGIEYETAAPWCSDPQETRPAPRPPTPRPAPKPLFRPLAPKPERRTINWLDE